MVQVAERDAAVTMPKEVLHLGPRSFYPRGPPSFASFDVQEDIPALVAVRWNPKPAAGDIPPRKTQRLVAVICCVQRPARARKKGRAKHQLLPRHALGGPFIKRLRHVFQRRVVWISQAPHRVCSERQPVNVVVDEGAIGKLLPSRAHGNAERFAAGCAERTGEVAAEQREVVLLHGIERRHERLPAAWVVRVPLDLQATCTPIAHHRGHVRRESLAQLVDLGELVQRDVVRVPAEADHELHGSARQELDELPGLHVLGLRLGTEMQGALVVHLYGVGQDQVRQVPVRDGHRRQLRLRICVEVADEPVRRRQVQGSRSRGSGCSHPCAGRSGSA
mmetsp:Transcript_11733/g.36652  ORF Transcript_11733/g.36652 Transcript_11733/m.36652 type:complete len:334 (+) Transcript_11733:557-1558(+)